ncbi:hypothetical protein [Streptomyces sp. A0592]|uniref:hypothetical protein n=1 Tax=Streptomyces sp. A0592 TaxID=2563099 RepID=UPI00109E59E8|nr:hypothetical protein [Streptomyces sp. A0592]THA82510.1 hypothetical protein E6U81_20665 [Streptomyces sp. A0592]
MEFTRFRRPSACLLLATTVGLGCTVVAAVEAGSDGGLVLLHGLHGHLVLLGWLALAALTGAILLGPPRCQLQGPPAGLVLVFGVPAMLLAGFLSTGTDGPEPRVDAEAAAPGRTDRRLVVVTAAGYLDPVRCVYVHDGGRLLERRWLAGCFNGDAEESGLAEAVWAAGDRVRMTTVGGEVHEVAVGAGGRPDRSVGAR